MKYENGYIPENISFGVSWNSETCASEFQELMKYIFLMLTAGGDLMMDGAAHKTYSLETYSKDVLIILQQTLSENMSLHLYFTLWINVEIELKS